jgi:UDP-N-acetylmuramoyl-L-alanyl-D-glutamate--2,6-diaminopimelate ligase
MEKILRKIEKIIPRKIYVFFQPIYHLILAAIGNVIYGFPGRKIKCIGVTGTNGKTTTCILILEMLKAADYKVGASTTNFVEISGKRTNNASGFTTMGRFKLQKTLRDMINQGCDWAVIEVTSQGLNQFRLLGVSFDITVFTNLTHEHLDLHGTMSKYREAKAKLFKSLKRSKRKGIKKTIISNLDDEYGQYYLNYWSQEKYSFGFTNLELKNHLSALNIKSEKERTIFDVNFNKEKDTYTLGLAGRVNVLNALACIAVGKSLQIDNKVIKYALETIQGVEGRLQKITKDQDFDVYVDYAITPDAAEKMYYSLKEITKGRLISVFGCTGNRDALKRPKMGSIAANLADLVFITDDETYNEDPEKIITDIIKGIDKKQMGKVIIERDRKEAILKAIKSATKGDVVVVSGMGHETVRNLGGVNYPWSDREVIEGILSTRG